MAFTEVGTKSNLDSHNIKASPPHTLTPSQTHTQSSTSVRGKLNEQLAKLHVKHNAEVEFLEDFKSFAKQRSVIEKDYAQVSTGMGLRDTGNGD